MITVRPEKHMYKLLCVLSVSGEFPSRSLSILGDARTVKAMVHKMEAVQKIRLYSSDTILTTKLFQKSGKGQLRTIRLNKNALEILTELHPKALDYYLEAFPEHKFSGGLRHIQRNHRVGEALAMCLMAGIEMTPYTLPVLQKSAILPVIPKKTGYYVGRYIKRISEAELNKTMYTRMVGLLFYPGGCYAAYNTREAVMKWSGYGELKAKQELTEIVKMNAGLDEVNSAILFGVGACVALQTVTESDKTRKRMLRFDRIFNSVHFVPLNSDGIRLVRILTLPDWKEKLMSALFTPEMRPKGYGAIEFDAYWENTYVYSHLDSDIARLIRLKEGLEYETLPFEVLCFSWQIEFLQGYLGNAVILKQLEMDTVMGALGIGRE